MRRGNVGIKHHRYSGFTLFEMVVVICSIVILYMVAEERLNELPAAAERASFYAVLEQIKSGINFEMVTRLARGNASEVRNLEGLNPIQFLIEPPSNYRGELPLVTDAVERRNSWYFESSTGDLVYVVGGASIPDVLVTIAGVRVNLGQIRLRLTNVYDGEGPGSGVTMSRDQGAKGNWQALVLAPVHEYTWERRPEVPVPID